MSTLRSVLNASRRSGMKVTQNHPLLILLISFLLFLLLNWVGFILGDTNSNLEHVVHSLQLDRGHTVVLVGPIDGITRAVEREEKEMAQQEE
jgi:hypothetical protein